MINKDYTNSKFPISSKSIIEAKEVLDCDSPTEKKITKINKIKNTSSRKVYKEYVGGVYHKSIFYY